MTINDSSQDPQIRRRGALSRARAAAVLAVFAGLVVAAPGAAFGKSGPPAGAGANGCYELHPGGSQAVEAKYNVGNPAQVLVAGDCDGGDIAAVDDQLTITVSHPSGSSGSLSHLLTPAGCPAVFGGPALDVTDLFKAGTHTVGVTVENGPCPPPTSTSPLYLVVTQ